MHDEEILFWGSHICMFVTSGVAQHRQSWPLMDEMLRGSLWWSHHTHCVGPSVKCSLCKCSPRNVDNCNFRKGDADHICTEARLNTHCLRVLIRKSNKLFDHLPLKKELQADWSLNQEGKLYTHDRGQYYTHCNTTINKSTLVQVSARTKPLKKCLTWVPP